MLAIRVPQLRSTAMRSMMRNSESRDNAESDFRSRSRSIYRYGRGPRNWIASPDQCPCCPFPHAQGASSAVPSTRRNNARTATTPSAWASPRPVRRTTSRVCFMIFPPHVGTKAYRILSPESMVWWSACRRVACLDCHVPGDPLPGLIRSVRAAHAGIAVE